MRMLIRNLLFPALALVLTGEAVAQSAEDYRRRQADLASISQIFGELHHIRRHCDPRREADLWRERMKRMIELEEPTESQQQELVRAFNRGFQGAQARYPSCDRRARDYAAARAMEGDGVLRRLAEPLYEQEQRGGPLIVTIPQDSDTE